MEQLFIEEYYSDDPLSFITETSKLSKGVIMKIEGPIGITETKNRNGRIYTNEFWDYVLGSEEVQQDLNDRSLVGSPDHPASFVPPMNTVSHVLTEASVDRKTNSLMGKAEVLDLPMGHLIKVCYESKLKVGASTRGGGVTETVPRGNMVIAKTYKWGGFDFCFRPSAQNAYPKPVRETVENIFQETPLVQLGENGESRNFYKGLLEKFGCNVSILEDKYRGASKKVFLVPSTYKKSGTVLYTKDNFSVVEGSDEDCSPEAVLVESFLQHNNVTQKLKVLTEQFLKSTIPEPLVQEGSNTDPSELSVKDEEISSLKKSKEDLAKNLRESQTLLIGLRKKLSGTKRIMGEKVVTFKSTVENLISEIAVLRSVKENLTKENANTRSLLLTLEKEKGSLRKRVLQLETLKRTLTKDNRNLNTELNGLDEEVKNLRVSYYSLRSGKSLEEVREEELESVPLSEFSPDDYKKQDTNIFKEAPVIKSLVVEGRKSSNEDMAITKNVGDIYRLMRGN